MDLVPVFDDRAVAAHAAAARGRARLRAVRLDDDEPAAHVVLAVDRVVADAVALLLAEPVEPVHLVARIGVPDHRALDVDRGDALRGAAETEIARCHAGRLL